MHFALQSAVLSRALISVHMWQNRPQLRQVWPLVLRTSRKVILQRVQRTLTKPVLWSGVLLLAICEEYGSAVVLST